VIVDSVLVDVRILDLPSLHREVHLWLSFIFIAGDKVTEIDNEQFICGTPHVSNFVYVQSNLSRIAV
jgi:hypothetical protein